MKIKTKFRKIILNIFGKYLSRLADKIESLENECKLYKAADNIFEVIRKL